MAWMKFSSVNSVQKQPPQNERSCLRHSEHIWFSTWRSLSRRLAANGANSINSANNGNSADRVVKLWGAREWALHFSEDTVLLSVITAVWVQCRVPSISYPGGHSHRDSHAHAARQCDFILWSGRHYITISRHGIAFFSHINDLNVRCSSFCHFLSYKAVCFNATFTLNPKDWLV